MRLEEVLLPPSQASYRLILKGGHLSPQLRYIVKISGPWSCKKTPWYHDRLGRNDKSWNRQPPKWENTDFWPKRCCWISIGLVLDWGLWFFAVLIPLVQVGRDGGCRSKQRKEKNLLRLLNSCQGWENSHWPVDLAAIRAPSPGPYLTSRLCSYTNPKKQSYP